MLTTPFLKILTLAAACCGAAAVGAQPAFPPDDTATAEQEPTTAEREKADAGQEGQAKPSQRDVEAVAKWRDLQASFQGPQQKTREAFEKYLNDLFLSIEEFAVDYSGTAASFEAMHELALMEIHARQKPEAGLARMKWIHTEVKAYQGPAPEGLRLDLKRYTFVYAIALADAEQFAQAEALLHPVAAGKDADAAQATQILARIKVQKTLLVGLPMPKFSGKQLRDGETLKIDDLKGKVVLVQFWATWSRPCDQEMPEVAKIYQELNEQGFQIVGVSLDDDRRDGHRRLVSYLKEKNMPWPQLYDGKGWKSALADQFFIRSIPTSFLLDKNGVIRASNLRARDLKAAVLPLL